MRLLTLDPGKVVGWATFYGARLRDLGVFEDTQTHAFRDLLNFHRPEQALIEIPRVYPVAKWKGDPNDLIKVAVCAGILMGILFEAAPDCIGKIENVFPHTWKGSRPKGIDHDFTRGLLMEGEKDILNTAIKRIGKTKVGHAVDAVGMGLWKLNRR